MLQPNDQPTLHASELAALRSGKIVLTTAATGASGNAAVRGLAYAPVPPRVAWGVLEQWDRMHEVLPSLQLRVARRWSDDAGDRHELVAAELSVGLVTTRYAVRVTFRPSELRQWWSLIPAEELAALREQLPSLPAQSRMLRSSDGALTVSAHEAGSLIQHDSLLVPHVGVPRALEHLLSRQLVREFLSAARREIVSTGSQRSTHTSGVALDRLDESV